MGISLLKNEMSISGATDEKIGATADELALFEMEEEGG